MSVGGEVGVAWVVGEGLPPFHWEGAGSSPPPTLPTHPCPSCSHVEVGVGKLSEPQQPEVLPFPLPPSHPLTPPCPVHRAAMWKWLGKLTDQQRSLIEERLKYTDKELAKQGLKPGFRWGGGEGRRHRAG